MFISGFLEFGAKKVFFEPKVPYKKKQKPVAPQPPVVATPSPEEEKPKEEPKKDKKEKKPKDTSDSIFCPTCGRKLNKDAKFCADCGSVL
jgi:hypothetical protein